MESNKLKNIIKKIDTVVNEETTEFGIKKSLKLLTEILDEIKKKDEVGNESIEKIVSLLDKVIEGQVSFKKIDTTLNKNVEINHRIKEEIKNFQKKIEQNQTTTQEKTNITKSILLESVQNLENILLKIQNKEFPKKIFIENQKEFPKSVSVNNFPETIEINNFPETVEINNLDEISKKTEVTNFPKSISEIKINNVSEFPKPLGNINVKNFPKEIKIKKPIWYKPFDFNILINKIKDLADELFNVKSDYHKEPENALAVKLIDKKGKVIESIVPTVRMSYPPGPYGSGNVGKTNLYNKDDEMINPATEEKQDEIIKEEDAAHSSGDKGVMPLTVRCDDVCTLADADKDYQPLVTNEHGILRTQAQQHYHIDNCEATTGWTVLGNDTVNLATTTNHVLGQYALKFDKVNGAANTVFAGIQKTITLVDLCPYHKGGGFFCCSIYVSSIADVEYAFLRVGTDSSNYNEWRGDADEMSTGWNTFKKRMDKPYTHAGNGWNSDAVTYVAIGIAFGNEADALADIAIDHISTNTGLQVTTDFVQTETQNINLHKVGNKVTDIGAGNAGNGTQRVSISTDDVNLAAIKTANDIPTNLDGGGKVSVGTTAVEATFTGTTKSIIISADKDNTGDLYIGKSNVTNAGANALCYLQAGESITISYEDSANAIYVVASAASQYFWKGALL